MLWEGRSLQEVREVDLHELITSGLEEHLFLEYKSELYDDNDRGRKEFLLDVCMFANTSGGVLLIGVSERRDAQGQPTGAPDPDSILGVDVHNPAAILAAYDARVMEAIEERLPLESVAIDLENGRRVLVFRIPNSPNKPHTVRHQGRIYLPARRERQRYQMNIREIKETVMRTASRLEAAKHLLKSAFLEVPVRDNFPYAIFGIVPLFADEFTVDIRDAAVRRALGGFSRAQNGDYVDPIYTFRGLERRGREFDFTVGLRRNGLLISSLQLPLYGQEQQFVITAIDILFRAFIYQTVPVHRAARIEPPFLMSMMLRIRRPLVGVYAGLDHLEYRTNPVQPLDYCFPFIAVDDNLQVDRITRPFCDQAHQLFGLEGSPNFNAEGVWTGRGA